MSYDAPTASGMPFVFTDSGYVTPGATSVPFSFEDVSTADLQAAINVLGADYVKECPTYTIATRHGVQVIQLPCVYGGLRHLGAAIHGNPPHVDLGAFINAVRGEADLLAYIRGVISAEKDLGGDIFGFPPEDLPASITGYPPADLSASIYGWAIKDLRGILKGIDSGTGDLGGDIDPQLLKGDKDLGALLSTVIARDLGANVFGYGPVDLPATISAREIRNLGAIINGLLKKGIADLGTSIFAIPPSDLGAYIRSWAVKDLGGQINVVYRKDLGGIINPFVPVDLPGIINVIGPEDLPASIHGWDTKDLGAILTGEYGDGDLQAAIFAIPPSNLIAYIRGMLGVGVPVDLGGSVEGAYSADLSAEMNLITPVDLPAYLTPTGKSVDLGAYIIPKTIYISQALQVSLLEHKNLRAMINSACFSTGSVDLPAYLRTVYKLDLPAIIFGFHVNIYHHVIDLNMAINTEDYSVEDKLEVHVQFAEDKRPHYTQLKITFDATGNIATAFDTQQIIYGVDRFIDLTASINGILTSVDLGATLNPVYDFNFTQLPYFVRPRTREVIIDFDNKMRENWRTFVEVFFDYSLTGPYHYFYVEGSNKIYRVDRDRHWTIWVKGYESTDDDVIERRNRRAKYIFRLSDYNTVDEAVRDFIDRVSVPRQADLPAVIQSIIPPHLNLGATISPKVKYTWIKHLRASMNIIEVSDLGGSITGVP